MHNRSWGSAVGSRSFMALLCSTLLAMVPKRDARLHSVMSGRDTLYLSCWAQVQDRSKSWKDMRIPITWNGKRPSLARHMIFVYSETTLLGSCPCLIFGDMVRAMENTFRRQKQPPTCTCERIDFEITCCNGLIMTWRCQPI